MKNRKTVGPNTPKTLSEEVYLHLRPTTPTWSNQIDGLNVVKIAKSLDAQVTPGDYIVKLTVAVPSSFFADAMPSARIELDSGDVVPFFVEVTESGDSEVRDA